MGDDFVIRTSTRGPNRGRMIDEKSSGGGGRVRCDWCGEPNILVLKVIDDRTRAVKTTWCECKSCIEMTTRKLHQFKVTR